MAVISGLLAALGAACLIALAAAWIGGLSLVMFSTGSMSPAIPAGGLALTRTISAGEVEPGDVVTAVRDDGARVTHRVVEVSAEGASGWLLKLKGDANDAVDPTPYRAAEVGRVVWSVPGGAQVISRIQQPGVRMTVTALIAAYVVLSLWPRGAQSPSSPHRRAARSASARP